MAGIVTYDVATGLARFADAHEVEANALMSKSVLAFVHESQKERGASAGFIGSNGERFGSNLSNQRKLTDQKLEALKSESSDWALSDDMRDELSQLFKLADRMQPTRSYVDALSIKLGDALKYYTGMNEKGLHLVVTAARLSSDPIVAIELASIYNFSNAKESSGIERAVLSNVFSKDVMSSALRTRHTTLLTKQDVFVYEALESAPPEMKDLFETALNSRAVAEVDNYRNIAASKDSGFDVDPESWFAAATDRINKLKTAELAALDLVIKTAQNARDHTRNVVIVESLILVVGIVVTLAIFVWLKLRRGQLARIAEGISIAVNQRDLAHEIEIVSEDDLGQSAADINTLTANFARDLREMGDASQEVASASHQTSAAI